MEKEVLIESPALCEFYNSCNLAGPGCEVDVVENCDVYAILKKGNSQKKGGEEWEESDHR